MRKRRCRPIIRSSFCSSLSKLKSLALGLQKDFYNACIGADAVVYHPGAAIGYFAARQLQIPSILATPFPMTPTKAYPSLIFYDKPRLGKRFNLATHKILEQIMWFASSASVKQFWKAQFGKTPDSFGAPFNRQRSPAYPTIVSCSNFVFPTPADWPPDVHNTGYWFLEEEAGWEAPADLVAFLREGPPPVYVGFRQRGQPCTGR